MSSLSNSLKAINATITKIQKQISNVNATTNKLDKLLDKMNVLVQRRKLLSTYTEEVAERIEVVNAQIDRRIEDLEGERKERIANIVYEYDDKTNKLPVIADVEELTVEEKVKPKMPASRALPVEMEKKVEPNYSNKYVMDSLDKCDKCGTPITQKILRAMGKAFHLDCFVCPECSKSLDGTPFTVDPQGVPYCVDCYHERFSPRCAACMKSIIPPKGETKVARIFALDRSYHVECYKCEDCGAKLSSKIEGQGCYPIDSHLFCKGCNLKYMNR